MSQRYSSLKKILSRYNSLAVACSGGVDSTFLLHAAREVLGHNVTPVMVKSLLMSKIEFDSATRNLPEGADLKIIEIDPLAYRGVKSNPPDRCYHCKKAIFSEIMKCAEENSIRHIAEGSNVDDLDDYRPGKRAIEELGILSPMIEAGLSKADIRALSREMGLATWDRPSSPCLATRIPFGIEITEEKLGAVEKAEEIIRGLGIEVCRVRHHGNIARIELAKNDLAKIFDSGVPDMITAAFKKIGFMYATIDLAGYRTGSMNDSIMEDD